MRVKRNKMRMYPLNYPISPIRKEVHSRQTFAYSAAERWLKTINHNKNGGNILMGKATHKFLQARRIYIHYANEFQRNQCLPLSK